MNFSYKITVFFLFLCISSITSKRIKKSRFNSEPHKVATWDIFRELFNVSGVTVDVIVYGKASKASADKIMEFIHGEQPFYAQYIEDKHVLISNYTPFVQRPIMLITHSMENITRFFSDYLRTHSFITEIKFFIYF